MSTFKIVTREEDKKFIEVCLTFQSGADYGASALVSVDPDHPREFRLIRGSIAGLPLTAERFNDVSQGTRDNLLQAVLEYCADLKEKS